MMLYVPYNRLSAKEKHRRSVYFGRELYDAVEAALQENRERSIGFKDVVDKKYPLFDIDKDLL